MAQISPELLEQEYQKYIGFKNFLKHKNNHFWSEMNFKYKFTSDEQPERNDEESYEFIKNNFTKSLMKDI